MYCFQCLAGQDSYVNKISLPSVWCVVLPLSGVRWGVKLSLCKRGLENSSRRHFVAAVA